MKLEQYKMRNNFVCSLTQELDALAKFDDESLYKHYIIMVDDYFKKENVIPIRVPGGTVGGIYVDDNLVINKVIVDTTYVVKTYPANINDIVTKYVGERLEFPTDQERRNQT